MTERHRTNSLHKNLPAELRAAVEAALIEQPPEAATYQAVHEKFSLADHGISLKAVERYGRYLRLLHRNSAIADLRSAITGGQNLGEDIASLLYGKLFLRLAEEDENPGDIRALATALRQVRRAEIDVQGQRYVQLKIEEMENKLRQFREKLQRAEADGNLGAVDLDRELQDLFGIRPAKQNGDAA